MDPTTTTKFAEPTSSRVYAWSGNQSHTTELRNDTTMTPEHNLPTAAQIDALTSSEAGTLHIDLGIAVAQIKIAAKALTTWTNRTYTAEDRHCLATHLEDARAILGEAQRLITLKTVQELEKELKVNDCPPCSGTGSIDQKDCPQCFGTGGYYPNTV